MGLLTKGQRITIEAREVMEKMDKGWHTSKVITEQLNKEFNEGVNAKAVGYYLKQHGVGFGIDTESVRDGRKRRYKLQ